MFWMEIYVSNIKLPLLLVQEALLTSASINFLFLFLCTVFIVMCMLKSHIRRRVMCGRCSQKK